MITRKRLKNLKLIINRLSRKLFSWQKDKDLKIKNLLGRVWILNNNKEQPHLKVLKILIEYHKYHNNRIEQQLIRKD